MKRIIYRAFIAVTLFFCTTVNVHAYWWRLSNFTTKVLLLQVKLRASANPYYALVSPNASALFDWSSPNPLAGFCLESFHWIEASPLITENSNLVDENHTVRNNYQMRDFLKKNGISLHKAPLHYFSSELYKKTLNAAGNIFSQKFMKWAGKLHALSSCRSRHITIIESADGKIEFFAQKS